MKGEKKEEIKKKIKEKESEEKYPKIYIITSAQSIQRNKDGIIMRNKDGTIKGGPNKNLVEGLEHYSDIKNAELNILSMAGSNAGEKEIHYNLEKFNVFHDNKKLNDNVEISDMVVPPQNVDPSTGRKRFVQREQTKIFAHPKQRLAPVHASNSKLPKFIVTPGVITYPNYNPNNHRGDAASRDHTYGGVIVEVLDKRLYNLRHMRSQKDGKFIDLGIKYDGKRKPKKAKVEALVLGDLHNGDTDPLVREINYEMIDFFKPERLVIHDFLNAHSVSYFNIRDSLTRAKCYEKGRAFLEEELKLAYDELLNLSKAVGKNKEILIPASNHSVFVDLYLKKGEFMKEPFNMRIGLKLASAFLDGEDPFEAGLKMIGKIPENVKFLKLSDDYKVWGYQLASHGHKGKSGARGSISSREIGHGKSITGHTHAPEILRNTYIVGTSTYLNLSYTDGQASAWMNANAVLYEGGLVQMIPIIEGRWKINK